MDTQVILAVALPLATLFGGWVIRVEQRLAQILAIKDDVAENRADVKDIYKHLLGKESTNGHV